MTLTLEELKAKLAEQVDEIDLLELLEIDAKQLVEAFSDRIEENYEKLLDVVEDDTGEED